MKTKKTQVDKIHPDPSNARKHSPRNIDAIAASLHRFGQQKPIVVDSSGVVRAGNGTLEAAKKLGWTEVAVVQSDLEGAEMTAFAIADNRTAELAEWDDEVLAATLQALDDADVPLADAGFTAEELAEVKKAAGAGEAGEVVEDEVPEAPEEPITKVGDLWILGRHRLLCGDSTRLVNLQRLTNGEKPQLMVTDPPYGVAYDGGSGNKKKREVLSGDESPDLYASMLTATVNILAENAAIYLWHASVYADSVLASSRNAGFEPRAVIIWNKLKAHYGAFMAHYLQKHEPCLYAVRGSAGFCGPSNEKTVWDIEQPHRNEHHPTQKPIETMARPIQNHAADLILDPFLGSGTTLIAAEQLGRSCYGMELSPAYCDVIVRRWENLTGEKAELA